MSFVGRSELLDLVDQFVSAPGGPLVRPGAARPVIVIEGCGGSGRRSLLRAVADRWSDRAMVAEVRPTELDAQGDSTFRPFVAALLLAFWRSTQVPGFEKVSFRRVVLAHIAMSAPVSDPDPGIAATRMRTRLNEYGDRKAVIALLGRVIARGARAVGGPVGDVVGDEAARGIVTGLRRSRWINRLGWGDALDWFGHQDQGFRHDPLQVLVRLSRQAALGTADVRQGVDDLLMGALLADLTAGMAKVANRPSNAVVLLHDGDTAPAVTFVDTLLRVRTAVDSAGLRDADPVTLVVSSGGGLTAQLSVRADRRFRWPESQVEDLTEEDVRGAGTRLAIVLGDLSAAHLEHLAKERDWPAEIGTRAVAAAVHQLTSGYPLAADHALRALEQDPGLLGDLDRILREPWPGTSTPAETHLLQTVVAAVSRNRRTLEGLITLSAAVDREEAGGLIGLLPASGETDVILTSPTLWSTPGDAGHPRMPTFLRFLLLRQLARRPGGGGTTWAGAVDTLRAATDRPGVRLGCGLMKGEEDDVVAALATEVERLPGDEWLALLDRAIATPDVRHPVVDVLDGAGTGKDPDRPHHGVRQLLRVLPHLGDPRLTDPELRTDGHVAAADAYAQLARFPPHGRQHLIARSGEHRRRSELAI